MLIVPDNLSLAPYCKSSDFCDDNRLIIADKEVLSCATYCSPAWGTTSWLDHVILIQSTANNDNELKRCVL